jgi:hypothetical protein
MPGKQYATRLEYNVRETQGMGQAQGLIFHNTNNMLAERTETKMLRA